MKNNTSSLRRFSKLSGLLMLTLSILLSNSAVSAMIMLEPDYTNPIQEEGCLYSYSMDMSKYDKNVEATFSNLLIDQIIVDENNLGNSVPLSDKYTVAGISDSFAVEIASFGYSLNSSANEVPGPDLETSVFEILVKDGQTVPAFALEDKGVIIAYLMGTAEKCQEAQPYQVCTYTTTTPVPPGSKFGFYYTTIDGVTAQMSTTPSVGNLYSGSTTISSLEDLLSDATADTSALISIDSSITDFGLQYADVEINVYGDIGDNLEVWESISDKSQKDFAYFSGSCVDVEPVVTTPTSTSTTIRRPSHRTRNVQPSQPASAACPYFTEYSTQNNSASASEVMKIQEFLNTTINAGLAVDGIHGTMTTQAIKSYQAANMDIITKWEGNILAPTGNWMYSTRNHGNEAMGCDEGNVTLGNTGIVIN